MTVATFQQPNYTTQSAAQYKANIDAAVAVAVRMAMAFAPHAQSTPDMTVRVDGGPVFTSAGNVAKVAAQSTATITAPTGNPRIDRVVVDANTGAVSVVAGAEAASPVAPAIPEGKLAVAQVALAVGQSSITNANITDERLLWGSLPALAIRYAGATGLIATNVEAALDELDLEKAPKGRITGAGLTMNTARLLGRSTANVGVVEELQIGMGLSLSGGVLSAAGSIKQIVSATIAAATGNTTIPDDNTAPLVSEGTQITSLSITPSSASNKVRVRGNFSAVIFESNLSGGGQGGLIAAVFRGSTLVGTARTLVDHGNSGNWGSNVAFEFEDSPASASALTYTVRVGMHGTNIDSWGVNRSGTSATALASSMANSIFTAEEISV